MKPFAPVPNWLLCRPEISQGAKLCYARLLQYQGNKACAFPLLETLASEIGVKRRQVVNYVRTLREAGLVTSSRSQCRNSNIFFLPKHQWSEEWEREQQQKKTAKAIYCPPNTQSVAHHSEQYVAHRQDQPKTNMKERFAPTEKRRKRWKIEKDMTSAKAQRGKLVDALKSRYRQGCIGDGRWQEHMQAMVARGDTEAVENKRKLDRVNREIKELDTELWQE